MTGRGAVWGSGVAVVLGSVLGWLTNELDGGWRWWAATGVVTVVAAGLAMWLASRGSTSIDVGDGAVFAGRDLRGRVRTRVRAVGSPSPLPGAAGGSRVGRGAVVAGRDLDADVEADFGTTPGEPVEGSGPPGPIGAGGWG